MLKTVILLMDLNIVCGTLVVHIDNITLLMAFLFLTYS